jgi:hypothetical protein
LRIQVFHRPIDLTKEHSMADNSTTTIIATVATREAAETVVEHLVQEHGIDRADVFVEAASNDNTAGTKPSGPDATGDEVEGSALDPKLAGSIQISVDVPRDAVEQARSTFESAGATDIRVK